MTSPGDPPPAAPTPGLPPSARGRPHRFRRGRRVQAWLRGGAWLGVWLGLASPLPALNPDRKADSYSIQGWFTETGLPSNKIRAVTQTRDGYLWMATAQGIARFDGSRFTVFTGATNPELRGGGFYAVLEAPDGSLWFGGDNGLFRWHQGRFDRFTTKEGLAHNYVRALGLTRDGAVVACTRTGYSFMRDGRIITPAGVWRQVTGVARAFLQRADGSVLLGTDDGLWRIAGETITRLSGTAGLSGSGFTSLLETPDGTLWLGWSQGVRCLHPDGTTEDYGSPQGLDNPRIAALRFDRDANLWIATYGGLYRLTRGRIESASYAGQFGGTSIQQLHEDREGGLWIATATGLFHLKDNISSSIDSAVGLSLTSVYSVLEANDGAWWIGVWGGGVYRYEHGRAVRLDVPGSPGPDQVLAFAEEPAGTLWIGSTSGLYRHVNGVTTNLYQRDQAAAWQKQLADAPQSTLPGIAHARINSIAPDAEGGLWVATDGALYHGQAGRFRAYTTADGLPGNVFKSVIRTRDGDIWVTAPPFAAARLRAGQWTSFRCGEAIADVYPRAVYEGTDGSIWVTTEGGGLNRFKNGRWRIFTTRDGLAEDFISGIMEDRLGHYWIACPRGIMRIPHAEFDELEAGRRTALQPRMFNRFDGLPAGETNQQGSPNAWQTRDGRLLFATDRGVAVIEPGHVKFNELKPPLYVESLVVNGAEADLTRPLAVPPGSNSVEIRYSAISLQAPEKVRFKIRLAPLDRDWVDAGGRRDVRYNQLPPGDYTFRVIGCNNDGVWNEAGATVGFTVRPFFYQTAWFLGLTALLVTGSIFGVFLTRTRRARRQLAILESLVRVRTGELETAKEAAEAAVRAQDESLVALKLAQEEAIREKARFQSIFESLPVGIAWTLHDRPETRIVNPAHADISGVGIAERHQLDHYRLRTHPDDRTKQDALHDRLLRGEIDHYTLEKRYVHSDGSVRWVVLAVRFFHDPLIGEAQEISTLVDITGLKRAEAEREALHRQLLDNSRLAGMAEVASGVLHNVGNALNSVNVSATLVADQVKNSRLTNLAKVCALLREHAADLGAFLTDDPKGRQIPAFLAALAAQLASEHTLMTGELVSLRKNIDHIRDIIAMQQNYARISGVVETVALAELVEDSLRLNASSLARHDVDLVRDYRTQVKLTVEKHKVLQILVNLVRNAKYACDEARRSDKQITVRTTSDGRCIRIAVIDNGVGIPAENLTRIFAHGFTTKREGHGFGLHSGALAAKELGGTLTAESAGPGRGATFTLELPFQPDPPAHENTVR